MAKSKAKAKSKREKKKAEDSDREALATDEYFVGMSARCRRSLNASESQRVSREDPQGKGQCCPEGWDSLGERAFSSASPFPAA